MNMKICVFAASSSKVDAIYLEAARDLALGLIREGHEIIYGGGDTGLMGILANTAKENGGVITGVIPAFMVKNGWNHKGLEKMIITEDMSSRKRKIFEMADASIALPGGIGTVEELSEAITLKQLGQFHGPIVIINTKGFYNKFLEFLDHLGSTRFMGSDHKNIWSVAGTPEEALEQINSYKGWDDVWEKLARI
jgi:uncharacterized protein (TIGR00730 family)